MRKLLLPIALANLLHTTVFAAPGESAPATPPPGTPSASVIDCSYRIPADTNNIDQSVIKTWATHAALQSFNFKFDTIDQQITSLKACYTDQGFTGFNDAMQKSGNIATIKSQQLTVNSQVGADVVVMPVKENQWKVTIPLSVLYQNAKEHLSQQLTVELLVGRKMSGDLGIMQMIATPTHTAKATP